MIVATGKNRDCVGIRLLRGGVSASSRSDRTLRDGSAGRGFPGISCQATFGQSLRGKNKYVISGKSAVHHGLPARPHPQNVILTPADTL